MNRKTNRITNTRVAMGRWIFGLAVFSFLGSCAGTSDKMMTPETVKSLRPDTIVSAQYGKEVSFDQMMQDLNSHQVIFVGEKHTSVSHHAIQLSIIQAAFRNNHDLIVGMEMFDRSYQEVLDLWTAGVLDEESFLRKTHWYANWRYDFSLYRDILLFIKQNKIKLVGLNIPTYIPGRIREGGVDSLSISDKRYLPKEIDTNDSAHRNYVKTIFDQHDFPSRVKFEDFYMAQCVWDEIMAESIARDLGSKKIIVLMGNGHIQYKYGVPNRTFRRTGAPFRTVYLATEGAEVELTIGDFIWITAAN